jgi:hypothetical protein
VCQNGGREESGNWWAEWVDGQEMCEDLGYDFVWQPQDWVLVRIKSLLHDGFLESQCSKGALKIQDSGFNICGASTICCKRTEHDGLCVKLDSAVNRCLGETQIMIHDFKVINSPILNPNMTQYAVMSRVQVLASENREDL